METLQKIAPVASIDALDKAAAEFSDRLMARAEKRMKDARRPIVYDTPEGRGELWLYVAGEASRSYLRLALIADRLMEKLVQERLKARKQRKPRRR